MENTSLSLNTLTNMSAADPEGLKSASKTGTGSKVKRPRKSLVAGEARRDRFQERRAGTGRSTTARDIGIVGRKTGLTLRVVRKDREGFDDLDAVFDTADKNSDTDTDDLGNGAIFEVEDEPKQSTAKKSTAKKPAAASSSSKQASGSASRRRISLLAEAPEPAEADADVDAENEALPVKKLQYDDMTSPTKATPKRGAAASAKKTAEKAEKPKSKTTAMPNLLSQVSAMWDDEEEAETKTRSESKSAQSSKKPSPAKASASKRKAEAQIEEAYDEPMESNNMSSADFDDAPYPEVPASSSVQKSSNKRGRSKKEESEHEEKPQKSAASKKSKAEVKEKGSPKKKRRQTMALVAEAQRLGLLDEIGDEVETGEKLKGTTRLGRKVFKPLQYWKNERLKFERPDTGIGRVLPTLVADNPVLPAAVTPPARPRTVKKRKAMARPISATVDENYHPSDAEEDPKKYLPVYDPHARVYDEATKSTVKLAVVKTADMIGLGELHHEQSKNLPAEKIAKAGNAFDVMDYFSSGVVVLPPGGTKFSEMTLTYEIFYVVSAAPNSVQVTIQGQTFVLSRGAHFFIPTENTYEIHNRSKKHPVTLSFTLLRSNENPAQ